MSAPVISTTTSILACVKGQAFTFQPAASNTPTSLARSAGAFPTGLTLNTTTGKISGTPTEEGVFVASITATNGTGTSAALELAFGVEILPFEGDSALQIDFDLATGILTNPRGAEDSVIYLKTGDRCVLSIGFTRDGILQELPGLAMITMGVKDIEENPLILLNDGAVQKVGDYDTTRYNILLDMLDPDVKAKLDAIALDNSNDVEAGFYAIAEIELTENVEVFAGAGPELVSRSSRHTMVRMTRELIPYQIVEEEE
jgi:hypothetical protein